jgi:protein-disulfide isomerase
MAYEENQLTKAERRALKKEQKQIDAEKQLQQARTNRLLTYLIVIGVVIGLAWFGYSRYTPVPQEAVDQPTDEVTKQDWLLGNADASVILVEYSDFQCPACKAYREVIAGLHESFADDQLAIVFRHFPLKTIHPQATLAAEAAEAAGKQGKFWEMHDAIFDGQQEWSGSRNTKQAFREYARDLDLNVDQFMEDLESQEVRTAVEADYQSGIKLRINSTPTFFINGERIGNPQGLEAFKTLINEQLQMATGSAEPEETL